jgi:serine/threonine protein kinase
MSELGAGASGSVYAAATLAEAAAIEAAAASAMSDAAAADADSCFVEASMAIKVIDLHDLDIEDYRRVLRELRLLAQLRHPNVVDFQGAVLGAVLDADIRSVGLVFERWDSTLGRVLRSRQQLTVNHARYFMFQILSALQYLHGAGVVHCDLKPENILLNCSCAIALADFGLARCGVFPFGYDVVQTSWYRAPEVVLGGAFGPAIDMWSAGCIFAEMLRAVEASAAPTARPRNFALFPVEDEAPHQLAAFVAVVGPPPDSCLRAIAGDVPGAFDVLTESIRTAIKAYPPRARGGASPKNSTHMRRAPLALQFIDVPPLALDLLMRIMKFDPAERLTAAAALDHPFFDRMAASLPPPPPPPAVLPTTTDIDALLTEGAMRTKLRDMVNTDLRWPRTHNLMSSPSSSSPPMTSPPSSSPSSSSPPMTSPPSSSPPPSNTVTPASNAQSGSAP